MKYENSYAEFREDIGCRERSTAARILLRESCKHGDEAQQPHFPVLCPSHPTLGAFAASLTCTSFCESSISQHTWLNTSPCYLLPIKQHIFCMYLWQTDLCYRLQSSACLRPQHLLQWSQCGATAESSSAAGQIPASDLPYFAVFCMSWYVW